MKSSIIGDCTDTRIPRLLGEPVRYADNIEDLESDKYTNTGFL